MRNVKMDVSKDNVLTITVDLTQEMGRSKSGKTMIVASSDGNVDVANTADGSIKMGLNIYK